MPWATGKPESCDITVKRKKQYLKENGVVAMSMDAEKPYKAA